MRHTNKHLSLIDKSRHKEWTRLHRETFATTAGAGRIGIAKIEAFAVQAI